MALAPSCSVGHPMVWNLAAAICRAGEEQTGNAEVAALEEAIREHHAEAVLEHVESRLGRDTNLLLLVDQFEEIFAFRGTEVDEQLSGLSAEDRRERGQQNEVVGATDQHRFVRRRPTVRRGQPSHEEGHDREARCRPSFH